MDKTLALKIISKLFDIENDGNLSDDLDYKDITNHRGELLKNSHCNDGGMMDAINNGLYKYAVDMLRKYASEDAVKQYMAENGHMSITRGIRSIGAKRFIIDDNRDALHQHVKTRFGKYDYGMFEFDDVCINDVTYIVAWN